MERFPSSAILGTTPEKSPENAGVNESSCSAFATLPPVAAPFGMTCIVHEICQPLSAMTISAAAALRWISRDNPNLAEAKSALQRVVSNGQRATAIVRGVRDLLADDRSVRSAVDINAIIIEGLNAMADELMRQRVDVETRLDHSLGTVMGDQAQLGSVVSNLIANAIDAMSVVEGRPRTLRISLQSKSRNRALVAFADSGSGVAPDALDRMFDPFFTTKSHGLGVGLSVCRAIVGAHGGALWAMQGEPNGSVFEFVIPTLP